MSKTSINSNGIIWLSQSFAKVKLKKLKLKLEFILPNPNDWLEKLFSSMLYLNALEHLSININDSSISKEVNNDFIGLLGFFVKLKSLSIILKNPKHATDEVIDVICKLIYSLPSLNKLVLKFKESSNISELESLAQAIKSLKRLKRLKIELGSLKGEIIPGIKNIRDLELENFTFSIW